MKITDVNAYVVTPPGHAYGGPNERQWTFVRIDTDEGFMAGARARTTRAAGVS